MMASPSLPRAPASLAANEGPWSLSPGIKRGVEASRQALPSSPETSSFPLRPLEGPFRGEGPLGHLLYSIALARNDKPRIAALLMLEANCLTLLPDTQRLHVAFTALDAIVCNTVPFTLKTGALRSFSGSNTYSERLPVKPAPRATKGQRQEANDASRKAPSEASNSPAWTAAGEGRAEEPPGLDAPSSEAQGPSVSPARAAASDATAIGALGTEAFGSSLLSQQQKGASTSGAVDSPSEGPPQHEGPPSSSNNSSALASTPEGLSSEAVSPPSSRGTPRGAPPGASGSCSSVRAPSPSGCCWLVVTRPFSVLCRVVAMQVWVSMCVVLDCLLVAPLWVERLVGLLYFFVRNVGTPQDAYVRAFACKCLEELELAYPGGTVKPSSKSGSSC